MRPTDTLNRSRQLRNAEVEIHFLFGVVLGQGHRRHCLSSLLLYSEKGEILQEWGLASQLTAHFCQGGGWIITSSKHFRLHFATLLMDKSHPCMYISIGRPIGQLRLGQVQTPYFTWAESNANGKILCYPSFAFDSARVKYGVWTWPKF